MYGTVLDTIINSERNFKMEKTYIGYARVSTEEQNTARQLD